MAVLSDLTLKTVLPDNGMYEVERYYVFLSFSIIEYTFISLFFYLTLTKKMLRRLVLAGYCIFLAIAIYSYLRPQEGYGFDSWAASMEGILEILFTIIYFYEQLNKPPADEIYSNKEFWIITGFFIYFSATVFLFNYTASLSDAERKAFWPINNIANIISNILIAIAFSMNVPARSGNRNYKT